MASASHGAPAAAACLEHAPTARIKLRSIAGGCIGNLVEWYDFFVYSIFSVNFASLFFPHGNQTAQLLNAFAVAAFGYVARPLGSLLMGRYADRNGCRAALALSISLMCGGPSWSR